MIQHSGHLVDPIETLSNRLSSRPTRGTKRVNGITMHSPKAVLEVENTSEKAQRTSARLPIVSGGCPGS